MKCSYSLVKEVIRDRFNETFDKKHSWTIYFLVDLKVVFIMTYAVISIVNLISSTANSEAFSDRNSMMPLNVSLDYINVNVSSINDAILWNCRSFSETNNYYKFLYWMLIIAMIVGLSGFFLIKFITLITFSSSFGCKCCSCKCSMSKHGLTKLWHIAICQHLINPVDKNSENQPFEDQEQASISKQGNAELARWQHDIDFYQELVNKDIPDDIVEELNFCKNCFRLIIPYILLILLVTILCLSYLSFDLHPLACITKPVEEIITYDNETNAVELEFSDKLSTYQRTAGYLCLSLGLMFSICVKIFFYCTKLVVNDLQQLLVKEYYYNSKNNTYSFI